MPLDHQQMTNWPHPQVRQEYAARDAILYALGAGVSIAPFDPCDLKYVFEGPGFVVLPTMSVVLAQGPFWMTDPALGLRWEMIVHAEQGLEIHAPMPTSGVVIAQDRVTGIYDKGPVKGALVYTSRELRDAVAGTLLATLRSTSFLRGDGGFGGVSEGAPKPHTLTQDRPPDICMAMPTRTDQAMIYRLSGDMNPLHVDPAFAAAAGFDRPILHGLCAFAIAGRAMLRALCGNDPTRLRRLDVRFAKPVFPGDTIRFDIWREADGVAGFRAVALERDVVVLNNGLAHTRH